MPTIMFQPQFVPHIKSGRKYRTIRPERKRPINPGDSLSLRFWEGAAYRSRQRIIIDVICTAIFDIFVDDRGIQIGSGRWIQAKSELDDFAYRDGFDSWDSMKQFFAAQYGLPKKAKLIEWTEPAPPDHRLITRLAE